MSHKFEPYDVSPKFCVWCSRTKDDPVHRETVADGFGNEWPKCSDECRIEVVRPGKVQCDCQ